MKSNEKEVLCIIPARAGSKGLKNKNIVDLCGKPLIFYTINPAMNSKYVSRVHVSTNCLKIKKIAESFGAEVPFLRPNTLASDTASIEATLKHHIEKLRNEHDYEPDIVLYLQPTDIFRTVDQINECIENLVEDPNLDSCFVANPTHKKFWKLNVETNKHERVNTGMYESRQVSRDIFLREDTGIACATRPRVLIEMKRVGDNCKIIENDDEYSSIDIHTEKSLYLAECVVRREINKKDSVYCFADKD